MQTRESSTPRRLSRRDFVTLGTGAFVVAAVPTALRRRPVSLVRRSVPVMGTIAEIAVAHPDHRRAQLAIDAGFERLRWVDRVMTRFTDWSDVGRANIGAAREPVPVHPETARVVVEALRCAAASDGAFDPCAGRAVMLWDVTRRREPPPEPAVRSLAGRALYRAADVNTWRGHPVVWFSDPDVILDLGGIAKGFGVDLAVQALRDHGITNGLVSAGGDLYALGRSGDGDPWRVGIRSAVEPNRLAGTIELEDAAVATSGDYLQGFDHGGRRYHHLLDPDTGAPRVARVHSVSVQADSCMTADAAATAVFGMEATRIVTMLRRMAPDARVVSAI